MKTGASPRPDENLLLVGATRADRPQREVVAAQGSWLTMADGRRLLDFSGQYSCIGVGHSHPRLREALHRAVDDIDFVCELLSFQGRSDAADLLVNGTMSGSDRWGACRFVSSGSEAVEMALVVARATTQRPVVVVAEDSYHGWTAAASAATTLPRLKNTIYDVPSGRTFLGPTPHERYPAAPSPRHATTDDEIRECVAETERVIRAVGVERVAAFMCEIYHGSAGFLAADLYVELIREMTTRLGILWIDDEAIAGAGRTGKWWAFQHTKVEPDIVVTAKGIGSSAAPAGAVIVTRELAERLDAMRWGTLSTNSGHPLAVAAVAATIRVINEEGLLDHVTRLGEYIRSELRAMVGRHASMASFSGRGLAWSIELVKSSDTGELWVTEDRAATPDVIDRAAFVPSRFVANECEAAGVLLFTFLPNTITLAPPLRIELEELNAGLAALDRALSALDERCTETQSHGVKGVVT